MSEQMKSFDDYLLDPAVITITVKHGCYEYTRVQELKYVANAISSSQYMIKDIEREIVRLERAIEAGKALNERRR